MNWKPILQKENETERQDEIGGMDIAIELTGIAKPTICGFSFLKQENRECYENILNVDFSYI